MILKKIIAVACLLLFFATTTNAQAPQPLLSEKPLKEQVEFWADYYQIDGVRLLKVIKCESSFNPNAIHQNDGGKGKHSIGVLQFQEKTFDYWSGVMGQELNRDSTFDQIKLAAFMWSKGEQHQWTCYQKTK